MKYEKETVKKKRERVPFKVTSKIKYLGINLTKDVNDIYTKNHKTVIKETEHDSKKWKGVLTLVD